MRGRVPEYDIRYILTRLRNDDGRGYGLPIIMFESKRMSRTNMIVLFAFFVDITITFRQTRFQSISEIFQLIGLHANNEVYIVLGDGCCQGEGRRDERRCDG